MKKVAILGSTGFAGRNLVEHFQESKGYELLCPTHVELDLLDGRAVDHWVARHTPDVIFHCAIFSPKSELDESNIVEKDLRIFLNLERNKDYFGKMFYLGSGAEYDKTRPICSVTEDEIGESVPQSRYGLAKYAIGKLIEGSGNIYNFRIFGLFGKYENWQVTFISNCCCKAIKGYPLSIRKDTYFDYLWIEDFCRIADWAIDHEFAFHTYNAGSNRRVRLSEIAGMVQRMSLTHPDIVVCREGYGNEYTADSTRLMEEYGSDYVTPLEIAVRNLYDWYEQHQELIDMQALIYGE